jgi:hypothetical protein
MSDLVKQVKHFGQGGTVENPVALIRNVVTVLEQVRELHRPRPNSVSALYPEPLCECGQDYSECETAAALDAANLT